MKQILFYCQHVLGMGHLMRSRALVAGMSEQFQVCFLNGGETVNGFEFPEGVEIVNLPPIKSDENFKSLSTVDGKSLEATQADRRQQILDVYDQVSPDILVIELFPFGRKKLIGELLPLLAKIRLGGRKTKVVCSLRDILVQRPDQQRFEAQVVDLLNRYFDLLLIHADPIFQRLEETFSAVSEIRIPLLYTGYVAQTIEEETDGEDGNLLEHRALENDLPIVLASIGGGRVGSELLNATVEASKVLKSTWQHQLVLCTGPYIPDEQFAQLESAVAGQDHIVLQKYTARFLELMAQAMLSISMAGYNTCMNVLTCGVRSLMLPFTGGNNDEQSIRANKLAAQGLVHVLGVDDLQPEQLTSRIRSALSSAPPPSRLAVNGVEKTVEALLKLAQTLVHTDRNQLGNFQQWIPEDSSSQKAAPQNDNSTAYSYRDVTAQRRHPLPHLAVMPCDAATDFPMIATQLRQILQSLQSAGRMVDLFVRDDDIDEDEESLRHLLDMSIMNDAPISLAVIPGRMTVQGIARMRQYRKMAPRLVELHQHGWQHLNHELEGRKCEFGPSRSFDQQLADIGNGKRLMEQAFEEHFFPAFTPPWNRCGTETLQALDQLGFAVFSRDWHEQPLQGFRFSEISTTLDLQNSKENGKLRCPSQLIEKLSTQLQSGQTVGLLLHHKVMDNESFGFFNCLLGELRRYSCVRFHTLQSLLEKAIA